MVGATWLAHGTGHRIMVRTWRICMAAVGRRFDVESSRRRSWRPHAEVAQIRANLTLQVRGSSSFRLRFSIDLGMVSGEVLEVFWYSFW